MQTIIEHNEIFAAFVLRVFLGLLFFTQGYDKVFNVKISGVIQTFEHPLILKHIPRWVFISSTYLTSYIELICGAMLILGFVKYYALYLLGIDLLMVAVAFSVIEPIWDLRHVFPRIVLLLAALMVPSEWDVISVDWFWSLFKAIRSIGVM